MATDRVALTVYSRNYCHLCDDMIEALRRLQGLFHFEITVIDVDTAGVTAYLENFR